MQVLDTSVLDQLATDLADAGFVCTFAGKYRAMLPGRVGRVCRALSACDVDDAMDAVLSLRVSSTAVGAEELATISGRLEADLRCGELRTALTRSAHLGAAARRADHELAHYQPLDTT